jgi:hypothetical protein
MKTMKPKERVQAALHREEDVERCLRTFAAGEGYIVEDPVQWE